MREKKHKPTKPNGMERNGMTQNKLDATDKKVNKIKLQRRTKKSVKNSIEKKTNEIHPAGQKNT